MKLHFIFNHTNAQKIIRREKETIEFLSAIIYIFFLGQLRGNIPVNKIYTGVTNSHSQVKMDSFEVYTIHIASSAVKQSSTNQGCRI